MGVGGVEFGTAVRQHDVNGTEAGAASRWTGRDDDTAAIATFCRLPAAYIHVDRFRECVPELSASLAQSLLGCDRLHRDLSGLIVEHYSLQDCAASEFGDARSGIALFDADQLWRIGEFAGGIWHAQSLRSVILVRALATVLADFDSRLHSLALENMDLSPKPDRQLDPAELAEAIRRDGMHCLNAAIARLPAALRQRVLLKLPKGSPLELPVSDRHAALGPAIVDRILACVPVP